MNNDKVLELLPCPFCGGKAKGRWSFGSYSIGCTTCGCDKSSHQEDAEGDAAKQWNTRSPAQALTEHRGEPLLYARMRDGEVDWSEDCVSPDNSCGDSYELEEGYTAVPLYSAPVTPVGDEVVAWLVPRLVTFKNAQRVHFSMTPEGANRTDAELMESLEGTICMDAETVFPDGADYYVEDKHGIKHYAKPLYLSKHPIPAIPEPEGAAE